MIAITQEFKEALVEEINTDAEFGFVLFQAILESAGERIPSVTYLDKALARQAVEFKKALRGVKNELDKKLDGQAQHFDEKLEAQAQHFDEKLEAQAQHFDEKLEDQAQHFDEKLEAQAQHFDKKLEAQAQHFDEKLEDQAQHFDEKLDAQAQHFDEKLDAQAQRFDEKLDQRIGKLERFIDAKLGYIGSRWGEDIEATFLTFAQEIIAQWGGTAQKWRRKTRLTDEHGHVFESRYEIDIVVANGKTLLVEVKSKCDLDDVERFLENVAYYLLTQEYSAPVETAILTFFITAPARDLAEKENIRLIMPS